MEKEDKLLKFKEVAKQMGIHPAYVGKFLETHGVPVQRLKTSRKWVRVKQSDIDKAMKTEVKRNDKKTISN